MDTAKVLAPQLSCNPPNKALRPRLVSLEGLPWPTAWEKHRLLAGALEAQEDTEKQPDSRRE